MRAKKVIVSLAGLFVVLTFIVIREGVPLPQALIIALVLIPPLLLLALLFFIPDLWIRWRDKRNKPDKNQ